MPKPGLEREFKAIQIEIGFRGRGVAPAVTQVDLLVGVHREIVHRIVPVVIEKADIHAVHARDAHTDVL